MYHLASSSPHMIKDLDFLFLLDLHSDCLAVTICALQLQLSMLFRLTFVQCSIYFSITDTFKAFAILQTDCKILMYSLFF